jgi:hypothetical protein
LSGFSRVCNPNDMYHISRIKEVQTEVDHYLVSLTSWSIEAFDLLDYSDATCLFSMVQVDGRLQSYVLSTDF